MKEIRIIIYLTIIVFLASCSEDKLEEKGFSVSQSTENHNNSEVAGINKDSVVFKTRPSNVLLTGVPQYRLTTIYKVNYNKKDNSTFIGSNYFHYNYDDMGISDGNQWNYNFLPGFEAVYGYNMVNISHFDLEADTHKTFFDKPVLIKTLYYPSYSKDTLNNKPINRNYYMVSVYDDDTNKDGYINIKDLRRFYLFNIKGEKVNALVPESHSVFSSEYDPENDYFYVYAKFDANGNGFADEDEDIHIFWIDLKNPEKTGRQY